MIVDRIQCEVWLAGQRHPRLWNESWTAAIDLALQVDDNVGLSPTVSFIDPVSAFASGTFSFGAAGVLKGARQRIYAESLDLVVSRKEPGNCAPQPDSFGLTGGMGIQETVDLGMASLDERDRATFKKEKAFGQTVQFVLTRNLNAVGPNWKLVRFEGPGGLLGAERVDTHQLVISFAPGAVTAAPATRGRPKAAQPLAGAARELNYQLLLRSLPNFRPTR